MIEKIKNIKLSKKQQIICYLAIIFVVMLVLNIFTPLIADDFNYKYIYGTGHKETVKNIFDVFISQYNHYMQWGGRTVAHTIAQLFLILPKIVFNFFNAACYVGIVYAIFYLGTEKQDKPYLLILIHLLLWIFVPYFGEDFLWLIGSCNYAWTLLIMLLFLVVYKKNTLKSNKRNIFFMFLFGIIAGWTNENTAFGLIVIIATLLLIDKFKKKKEISKWKISGLIGNIVGFIILIAAPGNFARKANLDTEGSFIINWIKRFIDCTEGVRDYLLPLIILAIILISYYKYKNKKINLKTISYFLGSFFSVYAMVLSPQFPERAWLGIIVFLIIPNIILLEKLLSHNMLKYLVIDCIIILSFLAILDSYQLTLDLKHYDDTLEYREEYIEKHKNKQSTFKFQAYAINNKWTPFHGADLTSDKNNWLNQAAARHYGVKYIIGYD